MYKDGYIILLTYTCERVSNWRISICVRNQKRDSEEREQASIIGTQDPLASKGMSILVN